MTKRIFALAFVLSLSASAAVAQTCSAVPNNLTNGSTADATQVMADFNYLLGCIGGLRGYIGGLTMSNNGPSPNLFINTSAGVANSDDSTTMMTLTGFTKNANGAWALGTSHGCLDAGSGLAANTWYHLFVIARTDTGVVDELCSTSATSPSLPASYTEKRRIGSFKTDGSSHILAFSQSGEEFLWATPVFDVNSQPVGTTAVNPSISVPPGVSVTAITNVAVQNSSGVVGLTVWPIGTSSPAYFTVVSDAINVPGAAPLNVRVLSSAGQQVNVAASVASGTVYWISTQGWIDTRGRFN